MNRVILVLVFLATVALADDSAADKARKSLEPFQGRWTVLKGQEGQEVFDEKILAKFPMTFTGDQMEMVHEAEKMVKLTVRIKPEGDPKEIDAQFPATIESGKLLRGIYKFEDGTLTLAFGLDKDSTRPSKFEAGLKGKKTLVLVLKPKK